AEHLDRLLVDREGMPVEAEEHDVGLDERMDVRQLADELAGVALADRLETVEAERVLALEDVVERAGDHRDAALNVRVADAEQLVDLQVGRHAQLVKVD